MKERGHEQEQSFWHLDEELGELELMERPAGPDLYTCPGYFANPDVEYAA